MSRKELLRFLAARKKYVPLPVVSICFPTFPGLLSSFNYHSRLYATQEQGVTSPETYTMHLDALGLCTLGQFVLYLGDITFLRNCGAVLTHFIQAQITPPYVNWIPELNTTRKFYIYLSSCPRLWTDTTPILVSDSRRWGGPAHQNHQSLSSCNPDSLLLPNKSLERYCNTHLDPQ